MSLAKLLRLPEYIVYFFRSLLLFKAPFSVLSHYINKNSTLDRPLELRNGLKILLSGHPHDLITVFVVFVKKDYGEVLQNNIVVDVGANIGAFSLLAAKMGAKKVFAYEPNRVAFKILQKNIILNNLQHIIYPYNLAVWGTENQMVKFPKESSPYNEVITDNDAHNYDLVATTTLDKVIDNNMIDCIDILKIDCEGCEFEAFFKASESVFSKINKITMEYHQGPVKELINYLMEYNFRVIRHKPYNTIKWLSKI